LNYLNTFYTNIDNNDTMAEISIESKKVDDGTTILISALAALPVEWRHETIIKLNETISEEVTFKNAVLDVGYLQDTFENIKKQLLEVRTKEIHTVLSEVILPAKETVLNELYNFIMRIKTYGRKPETAKYSVEAQQFCDRIWNSMLGICVCLRNIYPDESGELRANFVHYLDKLEFAIEVNFRGTCYNIFFNYSKLNTKAQDMMSTFYSNTY
jgi:hypothetical protein